MSLPFTYSEIPSEFSALYCMATNDTDFFSWKNTFKPDHFTHPSARKYFERLYKMLNCPPLLSDLSDPQDADDEFFMLMEASATAKMEYYHQKLEHARQIREIAIQTETILKDHKNPDCLNQLREKILAVEIGMQEYPEFTMRQLTERAGDRWQKGIQNRSFYHLGIPLVDDIVRLRSGNTVYIVAPPKVGKTWLEISIANFLSTGNKVYFLSAEMHPDDLYSRLASKISKIDLTELDYSNSPAPHLLSAWSENIEKILERNLIIVKARGIKHAEAKSKIYTAIQKGCSVVLVDYLQRIHGDGETERIITKNMSRDFTDMAGKYEKLFVIATQANQKEDGYTRAMDSKESKAIAEDADCVLSLTNITERENPQWSADDPYILAIDIMQRNGHAALKKLNFNPKTGEYSEYVKKTILPKDS